MQKTAIGSASYLCFRIRSSDPASERAYRLPAQLLRVMRMLTILLFVACMSASASSTGQSVTISGKDLTYKQIFSAVQKQTGYIVGYNAALFSGQKTFSLTVNSMPLAQFMDMILKDQPLKYEIADKTIFISPKYLHQPLSPVTPAEWLAPPVRIRVVDSLGEPLSGITVSLKRSRVLGITDAEGVFTASVKPGDVLVFSSVGFRSLELTVSDKSTLTVILAHAITNLEGISVVSTGFQTLNKNLATGTIEHVGQDVLANRPNTDLSSMLQGVVAGMQGLESANGNVAFTIRGISTLGTTNNQRSPLIVIDGFPLMNGDFSAINPNDVESVDVLKDAAASAIWGARSANGVIVITTKRAKGKQGLAINASAFTRIGNRPDLDQIYTIANAADQVAYERLAFEKKIYVTAGNFYQGGLFPGEFRTSLTAAQQLLFANKYGRLSTADMNAGLDALSHTDNRGQIREYLMRHPLTQQYNISISNNTERSKTYLSLLHERNKDRFIGNGYKKYDINFANEYKLTKFLTFNFNTFVQYINQQKSGATFTELNGYPTLFGGGISSYEMLLNPDGSYTKQVAGMDGGTGGPDPYILSQLPLNKFPYADWSYNLLREVRGRDLQSMNYNARIQSGLTFRLLPGLTLDTKVQYERGKTTIKNYYSDDTYYVRNMVNTNLQYNNTTKVVGNVYLPKGGILQKTDNDFTNYNFRGQLSYLKEISSRFNVNAILGGEVAQYRTDGVEYPWLYGYNPETLTSVVPPYGYGSSVDVFPAGTVTGANLTSLQGGNTTLSYSLDRYVSYFAASDITYNKKYTLSLNIRGDASNYITSDPKLRWSPFWSVGGNWDMKAENFMDHISAIDYLHLRASYGSNGTADKSTSTQALVNMGTSPNVGTGTITATISSFGNPYLHWERTHTVNFGADFVLFRNKLSGSVNLYNKQSTEVTGSRTLPQAYGISSQKFNNAEILNRGIEIQLGTTLKLPGGFGYTTSLNYAYNYNEVTNLYYPNPRNLELVTPGTAFIQGRPVNSFYTYDYAGVDANGMPQVYGPKGARFGFNSQTLLINTDGISNNYMHYAGTTTPPHTLGWRNTFSYRNFSVTAQLIGTFGGHFLNPSFNYGSAFVGYGKTAPNRFVSQVLQGDPSVPSLLADPAITVWPRYSPYLTSYVESSSYIQLKEVFLNYQLPQQLIERARFKNLDLFIQVRDLGMIWNNNTHDYHPDFLPGTDRPVTSYTAGLKFGF
ncbi:SusC/RagA family TonB-linked outer membrane protein [Chitinophaga sp.]|uniref:SusC/RagA family TonB-linked outer membrane protein n=1 Tax=Chitinophaga sp. TaxID=1869181 RepID=UPI002F91D414